jgi:hypothetical protein
MTTPTQDTYADKIAKLLAKAESTTPQEADALIAKAQELMTKYAIDMALVDALRAGKERREEIIEAIVEYAGTYRMATWRLAHTVATANNCRTMLADDTRERVSHLHVIGFESDVERVRMLDASLQIQMARALNAWAPENTQYLDRNQKFAARRQFMFSFTQGVKEKLSTGSAAGERAAKKEHGSTSVELVLKSRKDSVNDWMDEQYGRSLRAVKRNYKAGSMSAHSAGLSAGRSADVGNPKVGGKRAIGS